MNELKYKIDGVFDHITVPAIYGTPLLDKDGNPAKDGIYYLPSLASYITVVAGAVSTIFIMPIGGVVADSQAPSKKKTQPKSPPEAPNFEGISSELFLKTIALLSDKEKLDNIV